VNDTHSAFSGVCLVAQGGSLVDCQSAGLADRQAGIRWSPEIPSQIASISKQYVAVVALLLADQGVLQLDDSVASFLPEAPTQWQGVTLRHLMTHTSGLPHWCDLPGFDPAAAFAPQQRVQLLLSTRLQHEPGAMWAYSSPGYILLAAAIERAARSRYIDLAGELIVEHLALMNTTIGSVPRGEAARGYRDEQPVPSWNLESMPGTGDVWSSALDVATFITAVHAGALLSPQAQSTFRNVSVALGRRQDDSAPVATRRYGLGHFIGSVDGHEARLHPGDNPGYQAFAAWLPATHTTIVVISNDETDDPEATLTAAHRQLDPRSRDS
jgi:CubicO group peptidase (beta-lactamase class C family)